MSNKEINITYKEVWVSMYKSRFLQIIIRIIDWLNERKQEFYFILMIVNIPCAVVFGIYMYMSYMRNPMFENPSTIIEHFARPTFISLVAVTLVLSFGILIANLITMTPIRRIKFLKMEMEFDSLTRKEKEIANQFLYSSTMLHNHTENVRYLLNNNLMELNEVLQFLTDSYVNNVLEYSDGLSLTIDVVDRTEIKGRQERKMYESLQRQPIIKSSTTYTNRLIKGENVLVGIASLTDATNEAVMIVRRDYDHPFDIYDQETFESILGYAVILYDSIVMIELLSENNIVDSYDE